MAALVKHSATPPARHHR